MRAGRSTPVEIPYGGLRNDASRCGGSPESLRSSSRCLRLRDSRGTGRRRVLKKFRKSEQN